MKSHNKILLSLILNLIFSVFELIGGIYTGSIAVMSDSIHDFGDALGIGVAYIFEKVSKRKPNEKYSFGYGRYSVLGGAITTLILIISSIFVIYNSILRVINPNEIKYNSMIIFALSGVIINLTAAYFTHGGDSINQKSVNLHMLEDVLGWIVVLIGAVVIRFTNFLLIDPIMSIGVAIFILVHAIKNMGSVLNIFLEKTPDNISYSKIKNEINNIAKVYTFHIWTINGQVHFASLHIVSENNNEEIKSKIRNILLKYKIHNSTIEILPPNLTFPVENYNISISQCGHTHHHHH